MRTPYVVFLLMLVFFGSIFAGATELQKGCQINGTSPGQAATMSVILTNTGSTSGYYDVRLDSVTLNLPSGNYFTSTSPLSQSQTIFLCAVGDSGCSTNRHYPTSTTVTFAPINVDPNTPSGSYSATFSFTGAQRDWTGTLQSTPISSQSCSFSVTGATADQTNAQTALNNANSAISSATTAKNNAQSTVNQAGTSCSSAQGSWAQGNTQLGSANSNYANANSAFGSGNYQLTISDANSAQSDASSATSSFNAAASSANSCITNTAVANTAAQQQAAQQDAQQAAAAAEAARQAAQQAAQQAAAQKQAANSASSALSAANSQIQAASTAITNAQSVLAQIPSSSCVLTSDITTKIDSASQGISSAKVDYQNAESSYSSGSCSVNQCQSAQTNANTAQQLAVSAQNDAQSALTLGQQALSNSQNATSALSDEKNKLDSAKNLAAVGYRIGVNDSNAEALLSSAGDYDALSSSSCNSGDYSAAMSNAQLSSSKASRATSLLQTDIKQESLSILSDYESNRSSIEDTKTKYGLSYDTQPVETAIAAAKQKVLAGEYSGAVSGFPAIEQQLTSGSQQVNAAASQIDKAKSQQQMYMYIAIGIGAIVIIGGVVGLLGLAGVGWHLSKKAKAKMITCPNCKASLPAHAKHCMHCGAKLG